MRKQTKETQEVPFAGPSRCAAVPVAETLKEALLLGVANSKVRLSGQFKHTSVSQVGVAVIEKARSKVS